MSDTIEVSIYQAPNGDTALLNGVTNGGTVFGSQGSNGYIATADGTVTLVSLPGASSTAILGLNASGTTGCGEATVSGISGYFVDNGRILALLPPGETPIGVDDAGAVLIQGQALAGVQPSFLLKDGVAEPIALPTPGSIATAISTGGVIAGSVVGGPPSESYFVDTPNGIATYSYPFTYDGQSYESGSAPTYVNNAGEIAVDALDRFDVPSTDLIEDGMIVGVDQDPFGDPLITGLNNNGDATIVDRIASLVLTPSGTLSLGTPALNVIIADGINDAGEIVGVYDSSAGPVGFTAELPCFVAGTLIMTACGDDVPVEVLRPGDLVRTAAGAVRPVTWTGARVVEVASHPDPALVRPVVIRAGAFGPELPRRDLAVSPDHAIGWGDVLIPAKCLVDGMRVVVDTGVTVVAYHHVELAEHDLLVAEGLPAESFLDTGNRLSLAGGAGEADFSTGPDRAWCEWEARGCRRLVLAGPELDAARAALAARVPVIA